MATSRDNADERAFLIALILEELGLDTEDLLELARQATERACQNVEAGCPIVSEHREARTRLRAGKTH